MTRTATRSLLAALSIAGVAGLMVARPSGQAPGFPSTKNGEWPYYTADVKGSRYSPLDQINGTNFNQLEVAWRFKTDNMGTRPEFKLEGTPLMVNGVVDMKIGAVIGKGQQINLESGEIGLHSTPTVAKDVILVGSSFREGLTVKSHNNTKGLVRAWDVKSGKLLWTFNTIPRPGEFGNDTWEKESWAINGNTGVWSQITVDEELGLVYLPVEDPTSDLYGGHRPGNNLFGDSLVCVDLKTGQRKWHYQIVHHPIWDLDMPAAPLLMDIT